MKGKVKSYVSDKRFGFIDGEDGQSYFVHINDVSGASDLFQGQDVEFDPVPTPKGLSAKKVQAGRAPEPIYVDPSKFIMTKSDHVKGCEIIAVVGENIWGESNDPNEAREILKGVAQRSGGNAVVCMNLNKYTKKDACSNYKYTMHRYYGHAVVVKRVEYTTDPAKIAQSRSEISRYSAMNIAHDIGLSKLVKPPYYIFIPLLCYFWSKTILKIILLISLYGIGILLRINKITMKNVVKKLTKRSSRDRQTAPAP